MADQESGGGGFWIRTVAKGVSTIGGLIAAINGIIVLISFSAKCVAGGIFMVAGGVCVLMLEATMCFLFSDIGKWLDSKSENIKSWQRMFLYFALCIPGPAICGSITSFLGSIGFLLAGMCYMVLTIGRKGSPPPSGSSGIPYAQHVDDTSAA